MTAKNLALAVILILASGGVFAAGFVIGCREDEGIRRDPRGSGVVSKDDEPQEVAGIS